MRKSITWVMSSPTWDFQTLCIREVIWVFFIYFCGCFLISSFSMRSGRLPQFGPNFTNLAHCISSEVNTSISFTT